MFEIATMSPSTSTKLRAGRAGRYVQQPGGYGAFIPAPLPPSPSIKMDEELQRLLSDADRAVGRLDGVTQTLPDINLFLLMYLRKEALYSSQIEGTQASLDDVLTFESNISQAKNPHDVEEVVNYIAALRYGLERLEALPVSLRLMCEVHQRLLNGVRGHNKAPGELRKTQNWISSGSSLISDAVFVPPPPLEVQQHLSNLEAFLHSGTNLPVLMQIGLAHAQFETIHPFLDGNGRLGRLLITLLLCEKEILKQPALFLSHHFKKYKSEYYQRLQEIRDKGDWESWMKFFLRGVREVSREAANTAGTILILREEHRRLISEQLSHAQAGSAFKLLDRMYSTPVMSVPVAAQVIGRAYANTRQVILSLERLGILQEITGQGRNQRYRYAPYVELFRE